MIGSHDSYTHLASTNSFYNNFTDFWRCQRHTVVDQYRLGVRFFDIRVCLEKVNGKNQWRACHGKADLEKRWSSLRSICSYVQNSLVGSQFRLILEKGSTEEFINEVDKLWETYPCLIEVAIKNPWKYIYQSANHPQYKDYTYCPWNTGKSFWENLGDLITNISTIKSYAKSHNPIITNGMINDPNIIYFMDYAGDSLSK